MHTNSSIHNDAADFIPIPLRALRVLRAKFFQVAVEFDRKHGAPQRGV